MPCMYCGQSGHSRRTCTNGLIKPMVCTTCYRSLTANDFDQYQRIGPDGRTYVLFHLYCRSCRDRSARHCRTCGQIGHRFENCPFPDKGPYPCVKCGNYLPKEDFAYLQGTRTSCCKRCHVLAVEQRRRTHLASYFSHILRSNRDRMKRRRLPVSITVTFLAKLLEDQQWKCYYSGLLMCLDKSPQQVSVDRKDSNQGYTEGNVVLCCSAINLMKRDLDEADFISLCELVACYSS